MRRVPYSIEFRPAASPARTGFSLIEMLVVISIIAILAAATVPSIPSVLGAGRVNHTLNDLTMAVDFARAGAMANNTYVFIGFATVNTNNETQLQMWIVRTLDGTPNLSAGNIVPLSKIIQFDDTTLAKVSALSQPVQAMLNSANISGSLADAPYAGIPSSFTIGGQTFNYNYLIAISPQGEAILDSSGSLDANTPFTSEILVGLQATKGTTPSSANADSAAVVINGGTGAQQIIRL